MELQKVAGDGSPGGITNCANGKTCPAVYKSDRDTFVIQGSVLEAVTHAALGIPAGEDAVEVPRELIEELLANIS